LAHIMTASMTATRTMAAFAMASALFLVFFMQSSTSPFVQRSVQSHRSIVNTRAASQMLTRHRSYVPRASLAEGSEAIDEGKDDAGYNELIERFKKLRDPRPVVIIGAGISGLIAAKNLKNKNFNITVLEASDGPGGRVRTDDKDGFKLDRGFQVFLDEYPDVRNYFREAGLEKLKLKKFQPGALVYSNGQFNRVADPLRRPQDLGEAVGSSVGNIFDKIKVGIFRFYASFASLETLSSGREKTTYDYLSRELGLSDDMIDKFFRPFYRGIFLSELENQSSDMFNFVFKMLADGSATLPEGGLGKVTETLYSGLEDDVRFNTKVAKVEPGVVTLESGEKIETSNIIVATDGSSASELLKDIGFGVPAPEDRSSVCFYYKIPGEAPVTDPVLLLNGEKISEEKPINNVAFLSNVDPSYAPSGTSLASVTVVNPQGDLDAIEGNVRGHLEQWFGKAVVDKWNLLERYPISGAQPGQVPPNNFNKDLKICDGVYCCGDHMDTPTLNGAMRSGLMAADAISVIRGKKRFEILSEALARLR